MSAKSVSYDDPNREVLGLAPIWTGAGEGETPPPEPEEPPAPEEQDPPPAGRRRSSSS